MASPTRNAHPRHPEKEPQGPLDLACRGPPFWTNSVSITSASNLYRDSQDERQQDSRKKLLQLLEKKLLGS